MRAFISILGTCAQNLTFAGVSWRFLAQVALVSLGIWEIPTP